MKFSISSTVAEPSETPQLSTNIIERGPLGEPAQKKVELDEPAPIITTQPITFDNARSTEEVDKEQEKWKDIYRQASKIQVAGEGGLVEQEVDWWQIEPMHDSTGWMTGTAHAEPRLTGDGIKYTPWDAIPIQYQSEDEIMRMVQDHTGTHGIQNHHPLIANIIAQSFEEYPQLQAAYYNS